MFDPYPMHMRPLSVPLFHGVHYELLLCVGCDLSHDGGLLITHVAFHQDA